jgi:hypothetical protein
MFESSVDEFLKLTGFIGFLFGLYCWFSCANLFFYSDVSVEFLIGRFKDVII